MNNINQKLNSNLQISTVCIYCSACFKKVDFPWLGIHDIIRMHEIVRIYREKYNFHIQSNNGSVITLCDSCKKTIPTSKKTLIKSGKMAVLCYICRYEFLFYLSQLMIVENFYDMIMVLLCTPETNAFYDPNSQLFTCSTCADKLVGLNDIDWRYSEFV